MSFLKVERKSSGTYLRILESYRNKQGKPSSRVLYSVGKVEDYSPEQLRRMGIRLYELGGGEVKALLKGQIEEIARYNYGYKQVYSKALQHYRLDKILNHIARKGKVQFDLLNSVMLMLMERLHDPCSKRSNWLNQQEYLGIEGVELHHLYRSLDQLAVNSDRIQQQIFHCGRDLFNQKLDVVFYDVTTLYFDSQVKQPDALRQLGFSKDGKIGNTQILLCMMIDAQSNPVGYRIFKGNTFEGHTFEKALDDLKTRYDIDKIIIVADRGMLSKQNITLTKAKGYEFILGERLKSLPHHLQKQLLDVNAFEHSWIYTHGNDQEIKVRYTTVTQADQTIIVTYSQKRADKDRHEREEKIKTAEALLKNPSLINKKSARYFLKNTGKQSYQLDEQKIKQSEKYDGLLAISTNNQTLTHTQILDQYKQLYKIEHTFRTFKSHLETRPMFHWTDKRIQGHICLCYIAYTLLNFVLQKVNDEKKVITQNSLRAILDQMQLSLIKHNVEQVYIRSKPAADQSLIQQKLGLKQLPPLFTVDQLNKYL
ncbi:MAG: IS1634 family transposase [Nitrosomonas sp.]|nr:IS1634 family transposase [Nitrosomonas sp.]